MNIEMVVNGQVISLHEDRCVPGVGEVVNLKSEQATGLFYVVAREFDYEIVRHPMYDKGEREQGYFQSWKAVCRLWLEKHDGGKQA